MNQAPLGIAVLGCTGSIGTQTLDVARHHADKVRVVAMSAHGRIAELVAYAREFDPAYVVVTDEARANDPALAELPEGCRVLTGEAGLEEVSALPEVDCVVNALVGAAGIGAGAAALKAGKRLAYANKESIVVAGDLLMPLAAPGQIILDPGGISETEILLAYGGVHFASKMGQLAGNHFITLTSGLENLATLGKSVLWKGALPIRFEEV